MGFVSIVSTDWDKIVPGERAEKVSSTAKTQVTEAPPQAPSP